MAAVKQVSLEEEYKKSGISPQDIAKLREWMKTQPHLPESHITDLDLILTYHCCNHSAEVSKQVLDLNFTLKTMFTTYFKDRSVNDATLKIFDSTLIYPVKQRAYDGSAVVYTRLLNNEAKNFIMPDASRAVMMVLDLWQYEEGTWPGFFLAMDMAEVTMAHLGQLHLQTLQQMLYFVQEALLVKLKGIHFLNAPVFMDKLMMVIRPFMKKELLNSIVIHSTGSNTLEKHLPIEALPIEAGGKSKTAAECRDDLVAKLKANADFFKEENYKRVTESKRAGKPKTITDIFGGIEGSFKKLDID